MHTELTPPRQARLPAECEVSAAPPFLLAAACVALVLLLGLNTLMDRIAVSPAGLPTQRANPPAEETSVRSARLQVSSVVMKDKPHTIFRTAA